MAAFKMEGRLAGTELNETRFWTGKLVYCALTPDGVTHMSESLCLWNFLFVSKDATIKYLGFLDFDLQGYDFSTMPGHEIVGVFRKEFEPELNAHFQDRWFAYFSGSKGFHVYVLKQEFFFKLADKESQNTETMTAALRDLLPASLFERIDTSIYATNKGIRPWMVRNPKVRVMKRIRIAPETCPVQDEYDFFEWIRETLAMPCVHSLSALPTRRTEPLTVPRTPEFATPNTLQIDSVSSEASLQNLREWIRKKVNSNSLPCVHFQNDNGNIFFEAEDAWCFVDEKELTRHKRCKCWWRIFAGRAEQHCLAERHRGKKFILNFASMSAQNENRKTAVDFDADYLPDQVVVVPETEEHLPLAMMEDLLLPEGSRLLVCAPMGRGKTYCLNQLIQKHGRKPRREWKILILGTRICQCCVYEGAFDGSDSYLNPQEKPLYEVDYLVVCLNSLMRVAKYDSAQGGFIVPHFDLFIVDECMTVLNAITSRLLASANTNQPGLFEMFKLLLKTSERVVMMDGLPGPQIYRFLSSPQVNLWPQFKILKHVRLGESKKFIFEPNPMKLEERMMRMLTDEGKSVVVVSDSKKILKYLERKLPAEICDQAMTICGDSKQQIKKSAINPTENWKHLRYFGYNTAVGPGASYDAKTLEQGAKHAIFVFITCKTSSPSEIYQLISRIRWLLDNEVYVCVFTNNHKSQILAKAMHLSVKEQLDVMTRALMEGIVKFDKLAQHLPMTVKRQRADDILDYTELSLNDCPPELIRKLASEKHLRLVYEPNDFVSLLAWARLEDEKTKDSKFFMHELQRVIQLNGGQLETMPWTSDTLKEQKMFASEARNQGKTKESFQFPGDEMTGLVPDDKRELMIKMVEVENFEVQRRFFQLITHLKDPAAGTDRFVAEVEKIFLPAQRDPTAVAQRPGILDPSKFPRVACSLAETRLELCPPFETLVGEMGLKFNITTGHIEGQWDTKLLDEKRHTIVQCCKELDQVRLKRNPGATTYATGETPKLKPDYANGREKSIFFRYLQLELAGLFKWLGFAITKVKKGSHVSLYALDRKTSQLRYAMAGYNCDTLEDTMTRLDAIVYFAERYL